MIDCGSSAEKQNPVESIKNFSIGNSELLKSKPYVTSKGKSYPLALLHITHPDDDHVRKFMLLLASHSQPTVSKSPANSILTLLYFI